MPNLIFGSCPKCQREFHFFINKKIEAAYKKTENGIYTYRKEVKATITSEIILHFYFISKDRVGVIVREVDKNHYIGMMLDPKQKWRQVTNFGFNESIMIDFFSSLLNVEVKPDNLAELMDSLIWDKFYECLSN